MMSSLQFTTKKNYENITDESTRVDITDGISVGNNHRRLTDGRSVGN